MSMGNLAEKNRRRNMTAFAAQGIFFFIGYCFFDVNTVIPVFIQSLTGRSELAGVASSIRQFSTLLIQLAFGTYIIRVRHVPRFIGGFLTLGYAVPIFLVIPLAAGISGNLLVWVTFAGVALMWCCDGMMVIGYYDLLGRTADSPSRARILGLQQFVGGAGAIAGAFLVKQILDMDAVDVRLRYALVFGTGGCILLLGAGSMFFVRDNPIRRQASGFSWKRQMARLVPCFRRTKGCGKLLLCQALFTGAMMLAPFVLIICKDYFSLPGVKVTAMLNFQVLGTLVGGAASVFLAPKWGSRTIVLIYCLMGTVCGLAGLLGVFGIGRLSVNLFVMVLTSGIASASWAGFLNVLIDLSEGKDTHIFILMNSIVTLPLSLCGIIGGWIVKMFGYPALLGISFLLASCALWAAFHLVKKHVKSGDCIEQEEIKGGSSRT